MAAVVYPTEPGVYRCNWFSTCDNLGGGWYYNYMDATGCWWRGTQYLPHVMSVVGRKGLRLPCRGMYLQEWKPLTEEEREVVAGLPAAAE